MYMLLTAVHAKLEVKTTKFYILGTATFNFLFKLLIFNYELANYI